MKKPSLEKYLYFKGYTTKTTSHIKLKSKKGLTQFSKDMFDLIKNSDFVAFQGLVKEFQDIVK